MILEKATKQSYAADIMAAQTVDDIAQIITDLFTPTESVGFNAVEYITQQLFNGKSLSSAVNSFIKKFKGQNNMFLGEGQSFDFDILYNAVVKDKAQTAIDSAKKMKDGMGYMALDGVAQKFNLDKNELAGAVSSITNGENVNGILNGFSPQPTNKTSPTFPKEGSDYDNRVRGVKTRERINDMAKQILEAVDDADDLTEDQRQVLAQYSGKGGLTDNSQDQYYTPPEIARGVWDMLSAHGFTNGNVMEPAVGNGIFVGTKPEGVKVSGNDLDPVSSKIARLLNPDDDIKTGSLEEIAAHTPDNHFDAVIGNIPFGKARGKSKGKDPAYQNENRVDRYFILRTLDKLKPGGLCCLIVPTVIVGKKDNKWSMFRREVSKKAEFLGAHKLPSGAFSKGETGTDTVVDIVVFQKHPESLLDKIDIYKTEDLEAASVLWDEFISGRYWQGEGQRYIHGTLIPALEGVRGSRERVDGDIDNVALRSKLASKFNSRIDWELLGAAAPVVRNYVEGDRRVINGQQHELIGGHWSPVIEISADKTVDLSKFGVDSVEAIEALAQTDEGMLSVSYGQATAISTSYTGKLSPEMRAALSFADAQKDEYREQAYRGSIIGSRIAKIMNGENIDEDYLEKTRELVANEYAKFGHPGNNNGFVLAGQRAGSFGLFINAMDKDGNFSELLKTGKIEKKDAVYDTRDIGSILNYLAVRLERSPVELQDIIDLYSGDKAIKSIGDLAELDDVAISPDGMIYPFEQFCSGHIYQKIADITQAMAGETDPRIKEKWQDQIDRMLEKATYTPPDKITFTFQQKWFDPKYVVEFLQETGEYEDVSYDEETKEYDLGVGKAKLFNRAFEGFLNGSRIVVAGPDPEDNERKRQEYAKRVADLTERFSIWMLQHEDAEEIVDEYNRKFNGYVPFEHSGEPLGIEEYVSGEIENHTYQCAEVRRLSDIGSGICGHNTGLGKSFSSLALVSYNLKKNRSKRTCIVVPKSVIPNWYNEARTFYNSDFFRNRVKFVGLKPKKNKDGIIETTPITESDGTQRIGKNGNPMFNDVVDTRDTPADIFRDMWEIPQSNYALVVMSKEKFRDLPVKPDTRNAYVDEMVDMHLMSASESDKAKAGGKKKKSYDEAVSELNLEGKYSEARFEKGELPFFEDMGFDNVIYDECHFFKNSVEPGKVAQDTAFIPTAGVAAIAREMAVKSHYIRKQNCGRGVVGLSATPVTNSPFEIFNQLLQVADIETFRQMGINGPDDFIRTFGNIQQVQKQKMTGQVVSMDGLHGFQNLDGLRGLFNRFVNVKDASDVGKEVHIPEPVEKRVHVTLNDEQSTLYEDLRIEGEDAIKNFKKDPGKIFSILRDMERVSTDADMYYKQMTFTFPAKYVDAVKVLQGKLPKTQTIKVESDEKEGVFEKVEIPVKTTVTTSGNEIILVVPDSIESDVMDNLKTAGIAQLDVCHPVTPKYAELIANCKKHLDQNGKQVIFTEEKTQHNKIVRILLQHLPISEKNIAIINATEANDDKLDKISKAYNGGQVKIIVANKKAEVGVNLQRGTTAIHHLTLPWTPASIDQRNGRGVRQGNHVDFVEVYYYTARTLPDPVTGVMKGSADDLRLNSLQAKAKWIDELFNSTEATFLNPDADDDASVYADIFSSDPEEAARIRKEKKEEERRKALEASKQKMRIELTKYASKFAEYNSLDTIKEQKKADLQDKIPKLQERLARMERAVSEDKNEDTLRARNRAKFELTGAQSTLENIDEVFAKRKDKLEKALKQSKSLMENANRIGQLPFDKDLIDNPNCIVHIQGAVFTKWKYVEINVNDYDNDKAICKVVDIDVNKRTAILEYVTGRRPSYGSSIDGKTHVPVNSFKRVTSVSYTDDDVALIKAVSDTIYYTDIASKLTREQFERVRSQVKVYRYEPKVYRHSDTGKLEFRYNSADTDGLVYPEKTEDFAKEVVQVWIESKDNQERDYAEKILGKELFEKAWAEFVPKGSDSDIATEISKLWEEKKRYFNEIYGKIPSYSLGVAINEITSKLLRIWPNTEDVKRVCNTFFAAIKTKIETREIEERAERDRIEEERRKQEEAARIEREKIAEEEKQKKLESIKADPNFREVPQDIVSRLKNIGITIKLNTVDFKARGMNGAGGKFQRVFLNDSRGKSGSLFKTKDTYLKPILKSTFEPDWDEASGVWWHLPVAIMDSNGGFEKLASILESKA